MINKIRFFPLVSVLLVLVFACSSRTNQSSVSGTVMYNGQPVTGGTIHFHSIKPDDGKPGADFHRVINPDGTYEITDLPAEEMMVAVETESINPAGGTGGMDETKMKGKTGYTKPGVIMGPDMLKMMKNNNVPQTGQVWGTYVKIPKKYMNAETSGLRVTLKKGKNNYDPQLEGSADEK